MSQLPTDHLLPLLRRSRPSNEAERDANRCSSTTTPAVITPITKGQQRGVDQAATLRRRGKKEEQKKEVEEEELWREEDEGDKTRRSRRWRKKSWKRRKKRRSKRSWRSHWPSTSFPQLSSCLFEPMTSQQLLHTAARAAKSISFRKKKKITTAEKTK